MKIIKAILGTFLGIVAIFSVAYVVRQAEPQIVGANPSQIIENKSASATTTITYMTPGTATTTNSFDTQNDGGFSADSAVFALQVTATSTGVINPTVVVRFEDSQDGIDWYARAVGTIFPSTITSGTTTMMTSNPYNDLSFTISTSTASGFGGSGTAQRHHFVVDAKPTMRYVRAVIRIPASGGNVGVWSDFMAKKQNR